MKKIVVVGPFPPPVHGMAKNLALFSNELKKDSNVVDIDISPGTIVRGMDYHFTKLFRVLSGSSRLLLLCMSGKVKSVYMPPDAGFGAYYSFLFVLIARIFSKPTFLHHRSFAYLHKKTFGMKLITLLDDKFTTHVFLCEKMQSEFESIYGKTGSSLVVSNAQYVTPISKVPKVTNCLVLGHLSNLGFEKGLKEVFDVCNTLGELDVDFHLELGGPSENSEVELYLQEQLKILGSRVTYHGLVSNNKKNEFYEKLDVFLFPTQYRNEAQPNVLFEANANAVPVLSINTGCISTDVDCNNGFVFIDKADFIAQAPDILARLFSNPESLQNLKESTLLKINKESTNAKKNYFQLLCNVKGNLNEIHSK